MEQLLTLHKPRLYITNSVFHNPTGAVLSPIIAHKLLKLADQHNLLIVEDDIFADFTQSIPPLLASFDGLNRVVHVGSFSKTLTASVRCGYIAASQNWTEQIVDLKLATSFGTGGLGAELVYAMLRQGTYRHHIDTLRSQLADAMGRTLHRLAKLDISPWMKPLGGMFLWARLPDGLDAADVARESLHDGVVLAPGNVFSLSQSSTQFLRFNVAQCSSPRIFDVLEKAMNKAL
jgi:DNA-binding transcriptional MocR family regulator